MVHLDESRSGNVRAPSVQIVVHAVAAAIPAFLVIAARVGAEEDAVRLQGRVQLAIHAFSGGRGEDVNKPLERLGREFFLEQPGVESVGYVSVSPWNGGQTVPFVVDGLAGHRLARPDVPHHQGATCEVGGTLQGHRPFRRGAVVALAANLGGEGGSPVDQLRVPMAHMPRGIRGDGVPQSEHVTHVVGERGAGRRRGGRRRGRH